MSVVQNRTGSEPHFHCAWQGAMIWGGGAVLHTEDGGHFFAKAVRSDMAVDTDERKAFYRKACAHNYPPSTGADMLPSGSHLDKIAVNGGW